MYSTIQSSISPSSEWKQKGNIYSVKSPMPVFMHGNTHAPSRKQTSRSAGTREPMPDHHGNASQIQLWPHLSLGAQFHQLQTQINRRVKWTNFPSSTGTVSLNRPAPGPIRRTRVYISRRCIYLTKREDLIERRHIFQTEALWKILQLTEILQNSCI